MDYLKFSITLIFITSRVRWKMIEDKDFIELKTGVYTLEELILLDHDADQVLYATPRIGSELEGLVKESLPITFNVVNQDNTVYTQVIDINNNVDFTESETAAHAFITEDQGPACGTAGPPFLNDCNRDQAGDILNWLAGPLETDVAPDEASFIRFSQGEFVTDANRTSMDETGMAYIPQACRTEPGCPVHVVFHGCKQGISQPDIGEMFVRQSGYAGWAESNRLIILFPQAAIGTLNPNGCWDWWGYTGRNFLTRDALQMRAVNAMLERLGNSR